MHETVLIFLYVALLALTVTSILLAHKLLRLDKEMTELWRDLKITQWRTGEDASRSDKDMQVTFDLSGRGPSQSRTGFHDQSGGIAQ